MNYSQTSEYWSDAVDAQHKGFTPFPADGDDTAQNESHRSPENLVVIIDKRVLERECLARGLLEHDSTFKISAVGSLDEFQKMPVESKTSAIVVILSARKPTDESVRAELRQFVAAVNPTPVIVVADSDEPAEMLAALECGARGFIPTSVKVKVAAEAIGLALAGGTFVPANGLLALREAVYASTSSARPLTTLFTTKEAAVVQALRKGKANKIIAYELNLCESTVKVHIRNIMKKLKATNRTEVAYKLREMFL